MPNDQIETLAPVNLIDTGSKFDSGDAPQPGIALCLSGGGYRAMLFHVGALMRLNEWGYLPKLSQVSSVSGGSITAGVLGLKWSKLRFDANGVAQTLDTEVIAPIRALADHTIDEGSVIGGILLPGSIADKVCNAYRQHLFGTATLQNLPAGPAPRFVINATNVQSGALWRFSRPFMADYRVGVIKNPTIDLAVAVGASSAFPPVLSPLKMELDTALYEPASGQTSEDLHHGSFMTDVVLTDGGVYDNLGLETAWKAYQTILVSDGGGKLQPESEPKSDWLQHSLRVNGVIDNQVRSLRKRLLMRSFEKLRQGTYWGVRSDIAKYQVEGGLPCPEDKTLILANTKTRLKRLDGVTQERLINWGYAICDAAMRKWVDSNLAKPSGFPYPVSGIG
jgi:NTE family protein